MDDPVISEESLIQHSEIGRCIMGWLDEMWKDAEIFEIFSEFANQPTMNRFYIRQGATFGILKTRYNDLDFNEENLYDTFFKMRVVKEEGIEKKDESTLKDEDFDMLAQSFLLAKVIQKLSPSMDLVDLVSPIFQETTLEETTDKVVNKEGDEKDTEPLGDLIMQKILKEKDEDENILSLPPIGNKQNSKESPPSSNQSKTIPVSLPPISVDHEAVDPPNLSLSFTGFRYQLPEPNPFQKLCEEFGKTMDFISEDWRNYLAEIDINKLDEALKDKDQNGIHLSLSHNLLNSTKEEEYGGSTSP